MKEEQEKPNTGRAVSSARASSIMWYKQFNFVSWLMLSCCLGSIIYLSKKSKNVNYIFVESSDRKILDDQDDIAAAPTHTPQQSCDDRFRSILPAVDNVDSFEDVPLIIHRNGESVPCGNIQIDIIIKELKTNYEAEGCPNEFDKYKFESLLTKTVHGILINNDCHSTEVYGNESEGFLDFCDMGEDHTPILLDHNDLVPVKTGQSNSLPCHFHTREGLRITQFQVLSKVVMHLDKDRNECQIDESETQTCISNEINEKSSEIHLYAVPAGRVFMFAPAYVGEIFQLPHVTGARDKAIYLEVLSLKPRVFDVFNFFSTDESKEIVERAQAEKSDTHRIKRSTTGASAHSVNSRRTSESGFDTSGKTAMKIKKRCFAALGFDEYIESHSDGLQILRYNVSKAYNSHLDFIEDNGGQLKHDYESKGTGGNRYATILLYMSDLGDDDGGETVFPHGRLKDTLEGSTISGEKSREKLRVSERGSVLKNGSWEEDLVVLCRTRLAIRPHSSRAVLFYSQHPNGEVDKSSLHGACPVLSNQKYAANLWVWNTPRSGFSGSPIKKKFQKENGGTSTAPVNMKISATFDNAGKDSTFDNADLFYQDQFWGSLKPGDPARGVNTFDGHIWNVKIEGKVVKTWVITDEDGPTQTFVI
mmetsp:Transcript_51402/g.59473  ORF Transcript_51402/g.59473 Transcript_51402/m.59473 type:complete len:647 (+) Transcript_51402:31-1971(+)